MILLLNFARPLDEENVLFFISGHPLTATRPGDHRLFLHCMTFVLKDMCEAGYIKIFSGNFDWHKDLSAWFFYKCGDAVAGDIEFCAVDLWLWDKIKLFHCGTQVNEAVVDTVRENWKAIQSTGNVKLSFDIKLKGYPWRGIEGDDSVKNKMLVMKIIQVMVTNGWTPYSATHLDSLSTLFFCKKRNQNVSPEFCSSMFAISLCGNDRLRLVNAEDDVIQATRMVITRNWPLIQDEGEYCGSYEFKLKGWPWWNTGLEAMPGVALFCALLTELRRLGWRVMINMGLPKGQGDKRVFYFIKVPPKETTYCAISAKGANGVFGVNLGEAVEERLKTVIGSIFETHPMERCQKLSYVTKWSVKANPWPAPMESPVKLAGHLLIAALANAMHGLDYHLCCCADITSKDRYLPPTKFCFHKQQKT